MADAPAIVGTVPGFAATQAYLAGQGGGELQPEQRIQYVFEGHPDDDVITAVIRPAAWAPWCLGVEGQVPVGSGGVTIPAVNETRRSFGSLSLFDVQPEPRLGRLVFNGELFEARETVAEALRIGLGLVSTPRRRAHGEVAQLATSCKDLSKLTDGELAALLPGGVTRETFVRWRRGQADNPTPANLRRLKLLSSTFERASERVANVRTWLHTPHDDQLSPYELLQAGELATVDDLLAALPDLGGHDDGGTGAVLVHTRPREGVPSDEVAFSDLGLDDDDDDDVIVDDDED